MYDCHVSSVNFQPFALSLGQQNRASKSAQFPLFSSLRHQNPSLASMWVTPYSPVEPLTTRASTPVGLEQTSFSPKYEEVSKSPVPAGPSWLSQVPNGNLHLLFMITKVGDWNKTPPHRFQLPQIAMIPRFENMERYREWQISEILTRAKYRDFYCLIWCCLTSSFEWTKYCVGELLRIFDRKNPILGLKWFFPDRLVEIIPS